MVTHLILLVLEQEQLEDADVVQRAQDMAVRFREVLEQRLHIFLASVSAKRWERRA